MSKIAIAPTNHGIAEEFLERLDTIQNSSFLAGRHEVPIDPERAKRLLDLMVIEEAGAQVLFGTSVCSVINEGRSIKYALINSLNGVQAVKAKFFIDCTGDGQLAFAAGAEHMIGNEDGFVSSPTLMFRVGNCDIDKLITAMEYISLFKSSNRNTYSNHKIPPYRNRENIATDKYAHFADFIPLAEAKFKEYPDLFSEWEKSVIRQRGILFMNQPEPGHVLVNCTRICNFKGNDNEELSAAMVEGRKQCECIFRFMKRFIPGFEHSFLMDTGSLLGIRESRRIKGDYVFSLEDVEQTRKHPDGIVSNFGGVEIHSNGNGTIIKELEEDGFYTVPYRCITAKDFDNLYMAGRCFSASHPALSASRNIAYCMALGCAAATAAAILCKEGKNNARDIDIDMLKSKLTKQI